MPTQIPSQQYTYPEPYSLHGAPPPVAPYQQIASPGFPPFSPTGIQPGPGSMAYSATGYSPQPFSGPPGYGAPSPAFPSQQSTPTENTPPRPGSLPIPSGLPQRPAFAAPPVNAQQMQQMHMGHPMAQPPVPNYSNGDAARATPPVPSVNDTPGATNDVTEKPADGTEKPSKKDKTKPTRMIYSDQTVSPEEKMAQIPRYAFSRDRFTQETVLGEIPDATVTGTIRDQDTVVDPAH